jgi:hypothetical protein
MQPEFFSSYRRVVSTAAAAMLTVSLMGAATAPGMQGAGVIEPLRLIEFHHSKIQAGQSARGIE